MLHLPPEYERSWAARTLDRPLRVPRDVIARTVDDLRTLFTVASSLPDRLFAGDRAAYCRALGMPDARARFLASFGARPVEFGRADLYLPTDGAPRLLEYNLASDLGGTERCELNRVLAGSPDAPEDAAAPDARYAGPAPGDTYVHTGEVLLRHWTREIGHRPREIVLVCADRASAGLAVLLRPVVEMLERLGTRARLCELGDLRIDSRGVEHAGRRVDVVWRFFHVDHILAAPEAGLAWRALYEAHATGAVHVWTLPDSSLLSSKALLALLTSPAAQDVCSPAERAALDRLLPPCRLLDREAARSSRWSAERERLVLKPVTGLGGQGVIVGAECSPERWQAALDAVGDGTHLLQDRVVPRDEGEGLAAVYGLFVTPGGPAGLDARAAPLDAGHVVNVSSRRDVLTAAVFETGS